MNFKSSQGYNAISTGEFFFYRLLDVILAYVFMVSAAQEKCIDAKFFGSKLVNIGSFLPGDTQSSQQTRIACSSLLSQRDVK